MVFYAVTWRKSQQIALKTFFSRFTNKKDTPVVLEDNLGMQSISIEHSKKRIERRKVILNTTSKKEIQCWWLI